MKKLLYIIGIVFLTLLISCGERSLFVLDQPDDSTYAFEFSVITPLSKNRVAYPLTIMGVKDTRINQIVISAEGYTATNDVPSGSSWSISITEDAGLLGSTSFNLSARFLSAQVASTKLNVDLISEANEPWYNYYSSAMEKSGFELRVALHEIIRNHTVFDYSTQVANILRVLDEDPDNTANVVCIYSGHSVNKNHRGDAYGVWDRWDNEHLWPASKAFPRGTPGENSTGYSDLFNLYASVHRVNVDKSNYDIDICTTPYKTAYPECPFDVPSTLRVRTTIGNRAFEPPDASKGIVARALLYMVVRYMGTTAGEPKLMLTSIVPTATVSSSYHWFGEYGKLATLIEWHITYPPTAAEMLRNNTIYSNYQLNRNPFVDYPGWVTNIWPLQD